MEHGKEIERRDGEAEDLRRVSRDLEKVVSTLSADKAFHENRVKKE